MTINSLVKELAKREGKKSQARIGEIRELISILSDMVYESLEKDGFGEPVQVFKCIFENGKKRAAKKGKKK